MRKRMTKANFTSFSKGGTFLTNGELVAERENVMDSLCINEAAPVKILSDEELLKACGGRTGHKAPRFGFKFNGKEGRLVAQDAVNSSSISKNSECNSEDAEEPSRQNKKKDQRLQSSEDIKKGEKNRVKCEYDANPTDNYRIKNELGSVILNQRVVRLDSCGKSNTSICYKSTDSLKDSMFNFNFGKKGQRKSQQSQTLNYSSKEKTRHNKSIPIVKPEIKQNVTDREESEDQCRPAPRRRQIRRSNRIESSSSDDDNDNKGRGTHEGKYTTNEKKTELCAKLEPDDELSLKIDSNDESFSKLVNSDVHGNDIKLSASLTNNTVLVKELKDKLYLKEYDTGVFIAPFDQFGKTITGYINIAPNTLKPMTISKNARIICWVLKGNLTVRSTEYETREGTNYLSGKDLCSGDCIVVPPNTPYMLENRDTKIKVVLGYSATFLDDTVEESSQQQGR